MGKLPYFPFYPGDWLKDPGLRSVSHAAKGLWLDMLCLMFESEHRGYLEVNGKAPSIAQLARMVNASEDEVARLLLELRVVGVFSESASNVIYSRRMVKDNQLRDKRKKAGKLGGNPAFKTGSPNPYYRKDKQTDKQVDKQNISLSVSSSSSISKNPSGFIISRARKKTQLPEGFAFTPEMRLWAEGLGVDVDRETENFRDYHTARGSVFLDWGAAWRTWMRNAVKFSRGGKGDDFEKRTAGLRSWLNSTSDKSGIRESDCDINSQFQLSGYQSAESVDHVRHAERFDAGEAQARNSPAMSDAQRDLPWDECSGVDTRLRAL